MCKKLNLSVAKGNYMGYCTYRLSFVSRYFAFLLRFGTKFWWICFYTPT
jgi:hypothetical protein